MNELIDHLVHEFTLPLGNPVLVFALILIIILVAPILLRKLGIPGIIGLILSGVIIGPNGFNILEKNSAIDLFSTIGLLYIMFIAGIELDLAEFKANRNKSYLFGFLTFILPLTIGFPVCYYFLQYDFNASFLTASMFATHTLVAYPIVSRFGVSNNQAVAITVGGTILTDTAVLIILAIILGNSQGSLDKDFFIRMGILVVIFVFVMFYLVPRIAKWFFQKLESEKYAHYIFVLAVVFFAAFMAETAGLEPIIGAFMAGLALNRLIPHSSALMNRIEFIGQSLFIPFFLISVGMIVDVNVIASGPQALIIAATLSVVALIGKWAAAFATQKVYHYSVAQRQLIFGLSSSHAAATLAVIIVGYKAGILDDNILNGTIILILVTCIVASFATEKASKKIVIASAGNKFSQISQRNLTGEHILIPIANVQNMGKLLEFGYLIKEKKSANPVSLLSVVPNDKEADLNVLHQRAMLEKFVSQASASEVKVNILTAIDHNAASGIARTSKEVMADIIILGWPQKTNFLSKIIGEKVESIINTVDKNLFISFFGNPLVTLKRILVITPPFAERENGFETWLRKLARLAQELSIPVFHYGHESTRDAMQRILKRRNSNISFQYRNFHHWEDYITLSIEILPDDLLVLVSARRGSVSYSSMFDQISLRLEKHYEANSKIIIYPQQYSQLNIEERYNSTNSEPFVKGIETIGRLGKEIGSIFKKDN